MTQINFPSLQLLFSDSLLDVCFCTLTMGNRFKYTEPTPIDQVILCTFLNLQRQLEINKPPILQRIFVCLRSCCVEHIASYVTEATRSKTDKKASKMGGLFFSSCLSRINRFFLNLMALHHYIDSALFQCALRPSNSDVLLG